MTVNIDTTGMGALRRGDRVEIVGRDGTVIAGPLEVREVFCVLGDWLHLVDVESGATYMEGNVGEDGHRPIDFSHLPNGWGFRKLEDN